MRKILDLTPKKAIKIRIYPNKEQEIFLLKTFGCCRKIYNSFLELKQKRLPCPTEANFKKEHPYMFEVDSIALQQSCKILQEASDNYFKSLKGIRKGRKMNWPKFKSKKTESFSYDPASGKPTE